MFKNLLGKVLGGLTYLSPVRRFIKYAIDKTLNQLLTDQIKYEDFKDGELILTKLQLNLEKINKEYLVSSPYILHQGTIGNLKINLPNLSELSSKSIEFSAQKIQIDLKPNKRFYQNFKQSMKQKQQEALFDVNQKLPEDEISQNSPADFFKQLVRQIILNIKIKCENIVVRLFINQPQQQSKKIQYYLMLRVPRLSIGKSEQFVKNDTNFEEIKFNLEIPQISLHLLKEGTKYPEYANTKENQGQFPFQYPTVEHPSTLLLIGNADLPEEGSQNGSLTKFVLNLITNYKEKKKVTILSASISNVEATVDPIQLRILSRFLAQIQQFKKIYGYVIKELGLTTSQNNLGLSRKISNRKSGSYDFFTSVAMSINQKTSATPFNRSSGKLLKKDDDIFQSIIDHSQIEKQEMNKFNESFYEQTNEMRSSDRFSQEFRIIKFTQEFNIKFKLSYFNINIQKYVPSTCFYKKWIVAEQQKSKINMKIGGSYFMIGMKKLNYEFSSNSKRNSLEIQNLKIYNVKLKMKEGSNVNYVQSVSEEFVDISSTDFYNKNITQDYFANKPEIKTFRLPMNSHYCVEELFRISPKPSQNYDSLHLKKYSFLPSNLPKQNSQENYLSQNIGFLLIFNADSKDLKIKIEEVNVMANLETFKDCLNVIFPVFLYKQIAERISIECEQLQFDEKNEKQKISDLQKNYNINTFESQYVFVQNSKIYEVIEEKQQKIKLNISVELIYLNYRQSLSITNSQNLIEQVHKKITDADSFSKDCFCELNKSCIYGEICKFELKYDMKQDQFKMGFKDVEMGLVKIVNSDIKGEWLESLIYVNQNAKMYIQKIREKEDSKMVKVMLLVPKLKTKIEIGNLLNFISIIKGSLRISNNLLLFKRSLSNNLQNIEKQLFNNPRPARRQPKSSASFQLCLQQVSIQFLSSITYLRKVYFQNKQQNQVLKLDSILIGFKQKLVTRLGQYQNKMLLKSQYPFVEKVNSKINSDHIVLEIQSGRQLDPYNYSKGNKIDIFRHREADVMSIMIFFNKKGVTVESSNKQTQKQSNFQFKKNNLRLSSIIQEQRNSKILDIYIGKNIYLNLSNLFHLRNSAQQLIQIKAKLQQLQNSINQQPILAERKESNYSQGEGQDVIVKIQGGKFCVDIRPEIHYQREKERVFGNNRMFVAIGWNKIELKLNQEIRESTFTANFNLEVHFLHHDDRQITLNPSKINLEELKSYGFKPIFELQDIELESHLKKRQCRLQLKIGINSLSSSLCITTIPYIQLFTQHLLNHTILQNYGKDEDEYFEIIDFNCENQIQIIGGEEMQIEDLSQSLEKYEEMLQEKYLIRDQFKLRDFNVTFKPLVATQSKEEQQQMQVILSPLTLKTFKLRLLEGSDFNFYETDSLTQSKSTKRQLSNTNEPLNYFCLYLEKLVLNLHQHNKELQSVLQVSKFQAFISKKVTQNGWLGKFGGTQQQKIFYLFRCEHAFQFMFCKNQRYIKMKISKIDVGLGFIEDVLKMVDEMKLVEAQLRGGGWKRKYDLEENKKGKKDKQENKDKKEEQMVLIWLPEGRITLNFEYLSKRLISDQLIKTGQLLIHDEVKNMDCITETTTSWIMNIFKNNLGKIITGAAFQLFSGCIGFVLGLSRKLLGVFFKLLRK